MMNIFHHEFFQCNIFKIDDAKIFQDNSIGPGMNIFHFNFFQNDISKIDDARLLTHTHTHTRTNKQTDGTDYILPSSFGGRINSTH